MRVVDAQLESYVKSFETILGKQISFPVTISNAVPNQYVGWCVVNGDGTRYVQISSYWFPTLSEGGKEQTVFHELGHCELNRQHVNTLDSNNYPVSIMYYMEFGDNSYYTAHRDTYVSELFANATSEYLTVNSLGEESGDFKHLGGAQ